MYYHIPAAHLYTRSYSSSWMLDAAKLVLKTSCCCIKCSKGLQVMINFKFW